MALELPKLGEPFSLPLAFPDASASTPPSHTLTDEQQTLYDTLLAHFNNPGFELPSTMEGYKKWRDPPPSRIASFFRRAETDPKPVVQTGLTDLEKCFWTKEQFLRVLRSMKWDYETSLKRAELTVVWRRETLPRLDAEQAGREAETGKMFQMGFDVCSRPVLYMHPARQNTQDQDKQVDFLIFCLERILDLMPPTEVVTETMCLGIDLTTRGPLVSYSTARRVLEILQVYYCERLGKAVCLNIPSLFWPFWRLISPFVDPVTKEKVDFMPDGDATKSIPKPQLQKLFGGDVDFEYKHETYWPALLKLCAERQNARFERWKEHGNGQCGISEIITSGFQK